jgi:SAM-dependent methyltransferase
VTACHICGSPKLEPLVQKGTPFRLVSSDVQPVVGTAEYSLCSNCLAVQKTATPAWQAMAEHVYANYDINHQSQGAEPTIFDSAKGSGPRSLILRPRWKLSGAELVDRWKETVLALPGVEAFYSGANSAYAGRFDVISLSHVLEHIPDPIPFLKALSGHLAPGGRLLLAMPNLRQNPSDLIIADHCSHFDADSLAYVVGKAGLGIDLLSTTMLPKELVAVLSLRRPAQVPDVASAQADAHRASTKARCLFYFELLDNVRRTARSWRLENRPFGIMGSSIAACWTMLELEGKTDFFVDEDQNRIGRQLMGRPIVAPAQAPAGAVVFIPMSVAVAERIIERWKQLAVDFRYVPTNRPA